MELILNFTNHFIIIYFIMLYTLCMNIFSFIYDPDLKNINKKNFKKKFDIKLKDLKYHYKIFLKKTKSQ